jgi:hypothetical protein
MLFLLLVYVNAEYQNICTKINGSCIGFMILFHQSFLLFFIQNKQIFVNGLHRCPEAQCKELVTEIKSNKYN